MRSDYAEAHSNLGISLAAQEQFDSAIAAFRKAIAIKPNFPAAYSNLGTALKDKGEIDEAVVAYRKAIALRSDYAEAHSNLSVALKDRGQLDEAIAASRRAIALRPKFSDAHRKLIFSLHYHPGYDARAIADELRRWNDVHAAPLRKFRESHSNDRSPDRRLRIGYVSPDFRQHVVGRNLLPLFKEHDREQFEITCYAQVSIPDDMMHRFQNMAHRWRNIVGVSDEQAARQIREDGIDILVDLAMHTGGNRLLVFARKPAPVQVCGFAYPGSTGLETIDYRLTDPYLDPPGIFEAFYSEQSVRLGDCFWCYDPDSSAGPEVRRPAGGEKWVCDFWLS